jgi:hypothetical protein
LVPELCDKNGDFAQAIAEAQDCAASTTESANVTEFDSLAQSLTYCGLQIVNPNEDTEDAKKSVCSEMSIEFSTVETYCASILGITSNANANATSTTATATENGSIITSVFTETYRVATAGSSSSGAAIPAETNNVKSGSSNTAAIAGGAVGGVAFLLVLVGILYFVRRHRKRRHKRPSPDEPQEKAQLHSDDVKPDRKELLGSKVPQAMLEKKTVLNELPANEEVVRQHGPLEEMPSNEPAGQELETTENEMRALDRLTGTTQVSDKTN